MSENEMVKIAPEFRATHIEYAVNQRLPIEHYHDAYEINFFIRADVNVFILDKQYCVTDGDLMVISEYELHKFMFKEGTYMEIYQAAFKKSFIQEVEKAMKIDGLLDWIHSSERKSINVTVKKRKEIQMLLEAMSKDYQHALYSQKPELQAKVKANLVLLLLEFKGMVVKPIEHVPVDETEQLLKRIISYIDNNYGDPLSLALLAKEFAISKFRLAHIFKEITGFTTVEYIQQRRVIEVEKLLKYTNQPVLDICYQCGFNNAQHFHRVFKKIHGMTPLKLR